MQIAQTLNFGQEAVEQSLPGATAANLASTDGGFGELVSRYLGIVLVVGGLLLLFYLLWGGIQWMTSGGEKGQIEKARNKITQAVIGLIVLLASLALYTLLQDFFGFNVLNIDRPVPPGAREDLNTGPTGVTPDRADLHGR